MRTPRSPGVKGMRGVHDIVEDDLTIERHDKVI